MDSTIKYLLMGAIITFIGKVVFEWLNGRKASYPATVFDNGTKKAFYEMKEKLTATAENVKGVETKLERLLEENIKQTFHLEQLAKKN